MSNDTIGVDISKAFLDVHRLPDRQFAQFPNDKKGHKALIDWLRGLAVVRVVYEPTGADHRGLEQRLTEVGLPLVKVNPLQVRRFAQARGQRARTDRVDAGILAEMGLAFDLQADPVTPQIIHDLKALQIAGMALIKDRTRTRNRMHQLTLTLLDTQHKVRLQRVEKQLTALEGEMRRLIASEPQPARKSAILSSIKGISQITAAALIASRFNPDMAAKYQAVKAAGKPSKVAVTAVMRKLSILANTLIQQDRLWQEKCP